MRDDSTLIFLKVLETIQKLAKYAAFTLLGWFGMRVGLALAGKSTIAEFGLFLFADLKANTVVSHLVTGTFGLVCLGGWRRERRLRQRNIRRMSSRIHDYEKSVDPNRTSSGLTELGTTSPEDEI